MTMEQCYQALGGNYAEVSNRLPSARLVVKFLGKFLEDPSYEALCAQLQAGNRLEAFRAAHTLKGVCANLSLGRLLQSVTELTELLRPETDTIPEAAQTLMEAVRSDYQLTTAAIRAYLEEA